jgi:hypothetical protein
MIADLAILHGHGNCNHLMKFLDTNASIHNCRLGVASLSLREFDEKELATLVMQFIDRQDQLSLSITTQSSLNGLLKWTARLLSIGLTLPSVGDNAMAAVMSLLDLYILTVFRICCRNKLNEDALTGLTRKQTSSKPSSSSMLSLSIEADICSPFHGEDLTSLQNYVTQARERLAGIVNLDKFEASDATVASPRPKNDLEHVSEKFDKEIAAVVSCTFVALLVDVASQLLTSSMTSTDESSLSNSVKSFNTYATNVLAMTPQLIRQSCRLACTHAISAKDVIFQIICVGSTWEDDDIHEY